MTTQNIIITPLCPLVTSESLGFELPLPGDNSQAPPVFAGGLWITMEDGHD